MHHAKIKQFIQDRTSRDGLMETGIEGVRLFRATQAIPCVPVVYDPCIIAIVSGSKEVVWDGARHVYDTARYLCCPVSLPMQAGTPTASHTAPLFGVYISLDPLIMSELTFEMQRLGKNKYEPIGEPPPQGICLAQWDAAFSDALLRLLQLGDSETDRAVLGRARLRELYYAILKGEAGRFAQQSFSAGNAIAQTIAYVSSHLEAPISIDDMATRAGMSRAVFHRKFKQVTTMAPVQFIKSMRLNKAAMKIAAGMAVNAAALDVGYVSPSQFSREFKRLYGQSPRQWSERHPVTISQAAV